MRRARPSSMYEGLQGFSFPSNHATLSGVTYGFLAFFVARAWPWPTLSWRTATTGASCLSG
jgi:membrane-associated phospholipid phosphatase